MKSGQEETKPAPREKTKISPRLYSDNIELCRTYALNPKYKGDYQVFLKDLVDVALHDKNILKKLGVAT